MRQQEKEALQVRIQEIEGELTHQLQDWKKLGRDALVIGSSLGALYWLIQSLPADEEKETLPIVQPERKEAETSVIWSVAQGVATSVLLAVAKQALLQLINKLPAQDEAH